MKVFRLFKLEQMFLGVESVDALCKCTNILFTGGTRDLRTPVVTSLQPPRTCNGLDRHCVGIRTSRMYPQVISPSSNWNRCFWMLRVWTHYVDVQTSYLLARDSVFVTPCSSFTRFLQHPFRFEPVLLGG